MQQPQAVQCTLHHLNNSNHLNKLKKVLLREILNISLSFVWMKKRAVEVCIEKCVYSSIISNFNAGGKWGGLDSTSILS